MNNSYTIDAPLTGTWRVLVGDGMTLSLPHGVRPLADTFGCPEIYWGDYNLLGPLWLCHLRAKQIIARYERSARRKERAGRFAERKRAAAEKKRDAAE